MQLKDLKQTKPGTISVKVVITEVQLLQTKSGKDYLAFTGVDASGKVGIKKWDSSQMEMQQFPSGGVIEIVDAELSFYLGEPQLVIGRSTLVNKLNDDPVSLMGGLCNAEVERLTKRIDALVNMVKDEGCKKLLLNAYKGNGDFYIWPAAEGMHHSEKFGLLQHTVGVANFALAGAHAMEQTYGVQANLDVIITAALLHDIKKTQEYSVDDAFKGRLNKYSLIGHTVLGFAYVNTAFERGELSEDMWLQVGHAILAHHGKMEFGAPAKPSTKEAMIVSMGDLQDSRLKMFLEVEAQMNANEHAVKGHFGLDGARIYLP